MYLWVVIATFITILYSYNLSVRPDMERVFAETKAGTIVTKFIVQHNGVKHYIQTNTPEDNTSVSYYPGTKLQVTATTAGSNVITKQDMDTADVLPPGFSLDETMVSKVYCLNNDDNNTCTQSGGASGPSCCSDEDVSVYVVSYKRVPSKWVNKSNYMLNGDISRYISSLGGYGEKFGYVDEKESKLVISGGREVQKIDENGQYTSGREFVYKEIFDAITNDDDFDECADIQKGRCLFIMEKVRG